MTLGQLIAELEKHDTKQVVRNGFHRPHSYRGNYYNLAFEPTNNITKGQMLSEAKGAVGSIYEGYKGGDFQMEEWTHVYLAKYGDTGEELSRLLLEYMLDDIVEYP